VHEGVAPERIHRVGNVMIDSLLAALPKAQALPTLREMGLAPRGYSVCTLHRPSNVDDPRKLNALVDALGKIARVAPVVFPVHPRTRKTMPPAPAGLRLVEPMGYLEFLALTSQAKLVLTDSGGLQEESTALGVPCLTIRENTERPITVAVGTNIVVGTDPDRIVAEALKALDGKGKTGRVPDLWDGRAAERIAAVYEGAFTSGN
jgi:UDP-N-acetylglucosamine 2-epimerase (non-hydrolysing)